MTTDNKIATAAGKPPLHWLPLRWLTGLARVFEFGAAKHGRENYYTSDSDPETCERYIGGVLRHLSAMQTPGGSYTPSSCAALDAESQLPHLHHAIAGLVMLAARLGKDGAMPADPRVDPGMRKEPLRVAFYATRNTAAQRLWAAGWRASWSDAGAGTLASIETEEEALRVAEHFARRLAGACPGVLVEVVKQQGGKREEVVATWDGHRKTWT